MKKQSFWRYLTVAIMLGLIGTSILVQIVRIQNSPEVAGSPARCIYLENFLSGAWRNIRPKWQPAGREQDSL